MRTAYHERLDDMVEQLGKITRLVASAMSRANNALLDADIEMAEPRFSYPFTSWMLCTMPL